MGLMVVWDEWEDYEVVPKMHEVGFGNEVSTFITQETGAKP